MVDTLSDKRQSLTRNALLALSYQERAITQVLGVRGVACLLFLANFRSTLRVCFISQFAYCKRKSVLFVGPTSIFDYVRV